MSLLDRHAREERAEHAMTETVISEPPPEIFRTMMGAFSEMAHKQTELVGELKGLFLNNVFYQGTAQLDATGLWTKSFQLPFAAVALWNHSVDRITVAAEAPQSNPPASGNGITRVNPGRWACVPMTGQTITLYGRDAATGLIPTADLVTIAVYNRAQPPAGGDA